ncbi:hypothetical protein [Solidesulfovibrio sp.]|uniref:hypothetical protein n=1 Tax=Solidesulfovibrio sp. TaxID=2910990 RepID=UPI0026312DC8|nr:hypothetical protein [Solidesulfovibrio sp.]
MGAWRDGIYAALAAGWLCVAAGTAISDWPTPAKLSRERLRLALLWANALDKDLRPYDTPIGPDPDAQYQELVADYTARFGDRFDIGFVARRHADALAGMDRERAGVAAFALASTAAVWGLLATIRKLLGHPRAEDA